MCRVCDRNIRSNQHAVECAGCCGWIHKGCTGLSGSEFDKVCAIFKKTGSHNWNCKSCDKSEVKRVSMGARNSDTGRDRSMTSKTHIPTTTDKRHSAGDSPEIRPDATLSTPMDIHFVKDQISTLLRKNNASIKDVVLMFSHVVSVLLDQKSDIKVVLDEFRHGSNERIDRLEAEVSELRSNILKLQNGGIKGNSMPVYHAQKSITDEHDVLTEMQDRCIRARNVIVYHIEESKSQVSAERIDHDRAQFVSVWEAMALDNIPDFKVFRIGRPGQKPRPIKIVFPSESHVKECLRNKRRLIDNNINIKPDLTPTQRDTMKRLYNDINSRKEKGETDLVIRYKNGNPYVIKNKSAQFPIHDVQNANLQMDNAPKNSQ